MNSDNPVLIALGGNALILPGEKGYIEEQFGHAAACMKPVASLLAQGVKLVLTHGNGPIVGNILLRNECAKDYIAPMPLYICVADSQGGIGAMMAESLGNELRKLGRDIPVAAIITHVVVDRYDHAFVEPTKPIGPYYSDEEAQHYMERKGWKMKHVNGRGWRRLVPSPRPLSIVEIEAVRMALANGIVPIATGGGGIPVIEEDGRFRGADAVIDKDHAACLLGHQLGIKKFIIVTDIDGVYIDLDGPDRAMLQRMDLWQAKRYLQDGQFPSGSMGPKIEAAIAFLEGGGEEVIITNPELLEAAMKGDAGTRIVP